MGAFTLIQSGFFSAATSGRWAFSGWRGLLVASSTTVMAAPQLTYGCEAAGARRPPRARLCARLQAAGPLAPQSDGPGPSAVPLPVQQLYRLTVLVEEDA